MWLRPLGLSPVHFGMSVTVFASWFEVIHLPRWIPGGEARGRHVELVT